MSHKLLDIEESNNSDIEIDEINSTINRVNQNSPNKEHLVSAWLNSIPNTCQPHYELTQQDSLMNDPELVDLTETDNVTESKITLDDDLPNQPPLITVSHSKVSTNHRTDSTSITAVKNCSNEDVKESPVNSSMKDPILGEDQYKFTPNFNNFLAGGTLKESIKKPRRSIIIINSSNNNQEFSQSQLDQVPELVKSIPETKPPHIVANTPEVIALDPILKPIKLGRKQSEYISAHEFGEYDFTHKGENPKVWKAYGDNITEILPSDSNRTIHDIPGFPQFRTLLFRDEPEAKTRVLGNKRDFGHSSSNSSEKYEVNSLMEDFYVEHPWVDRSIPHVGPFEMEMFSQQNNEGQALACLSNKLCPWPTTLFPINDDFAKGLSIVFEKNGKLVELVARTKACRQTNQNRITRRSRVFFCEVCDNIIVPNISVFNYCYSYHKNATNEEREEWGESFLRVCFVHFVKHGKNNGRYFRVAYKQNAPNKWDVRENRFKKAVYDA